jgi:hypothetical protein
MSLQLQDGEVLIENDCLTFPLSLRDDEELFLVSSAPVSSVHKVIAVERIKFTVLCQVN